LRQFDRILGKQVGSICFASARYHYALQAADFLAWVTRRHLADKVSGRVPPRGWGMLLADMPYGMLDYRGEHWDKAEIDAQFPKSLSEII
jgi:hypothetical protein